MNHKISNLENDGHQQGWGKAAGRRLAAALGSSSSVLWIAVLGTLVLLPALQLGFQLDDHFQRAKLLGFDPPAIQLFVFYDGVPANNQLQMEQGFLPWWAAEGLKHANFRYLSVLTMMLDYKLWPESPLLMHLHSLLWLFGLLVAVGFLYRRVQDRFASGPVWIAGLAALFYALDDAHSFPAAYLANRNALLATFFGVLTLLFYLKLIEPPQRVLAPGVSGSHSRWRLSLVAGPICLALALCSAELAVSTCVYLGAAALFLGEDPQGKLKGRLRRNFTLLLPFVAVSIGWAGIYRILGFGSADSGYYFDPVSNPLAFAKLLVTRSSLLVLGQWSPIPSDLSGGLDLSSSAGRFLVALAFGVFLAVLVLTYGLQRKKTWERDGVSDREASVRSAVVRFWAAGSLGSLLPIAATGPQNRLLFFVGVGAMALVASVAELAFKGSRGARRKVLLAATVGLIIVHGPLAVMLSQAFLSLNHGANQKMIQAVESLPMDQELVGQDLVLVNPPDTVYLIGSIPMIRWSEDQARPKRLRTLAHGASAMAITRTGPGQLRVNLESSLFPNDFSRYHRTSALPFSSGDTVELAGFAAQVLAVDEQGDPKELLFDFDVSLEDSGLRWVHYEDREYKSFVPPPLGETIALAAQPSIFTP